MAHATQKRWKVTSTERMFDGLELEDVPIPTPGAYEVLVRIHAVSLNFRDLMIPKVVILHL